MTTNLLARILDMKRAEVRALVQSTRAKRVGRVPIDVVAALRRTTGSPLRLITEVKFKSPSAGELSRTLDAAARAVTYAKNGAAMVSVLTDFTFFGGSWEDLALAKLALKAAHLQVPVLAKEFVIDEMQIIKADEQGADAVLLIARIVKETRLSALVQAVRERGMEPLVEVVTEEERDMALRAGARVIGVNARDLDTLAMDPARAASILDTIPASCVAVHLSGIRDAASLAPVVKSRADAALIGEALMRQEDPAPLLLDLVSAAR